ncbi:hypothetical protein Pmani_007518 [Petrolisthes manimaculis]|uniref:PNPLA domain-containing protein n=1 Tax=Petrolisthes manimaculis TaxID=1843537 RepID=A0AAE1Q895_9EUCA|nr:hypothetical protein Pmani_007518 [Petrolisthes manimaculis]
MSVPFIKITDVNNDPQETSNHGSFRRRSSSGSRASGSEYEPSTDAAPRDLQNTTHDYSRQHTAPDNALIAADDRDRGRDQEQGWNNETTRTLILPDLNDYVSSPRRVSADDGSAQQREEDEVQVQTRTISSHLGEPVSGNHVNRERRRSFNDIIFNIEHRKSIHEMTPKMRAQVSKFEGLLDDEISPSMESYAEGDRRRLSSRNISEMDHREDSSRNKEDMSRRRSSSRDFPETEHRRRSSAQDEPEMDRRRLSSNDVPETELRRSVDSDGVWKTAFNIDKPETGRRRSSTRDTEMERRPSKGNTIPEKKQRKSSRGEYMPGMERRSSSREIPEVNRRRSSSREVPEVYRRRSSSREDPEAYRRRSSSREVPEAYRRRSSSREVPEADRRRSSSREVPEVYRRRSSSREVPERDRRRSSSHMLQVDGRGSSSWGDVPYMGRRISSDGEEFQVFERRGSQEGRDLLGRRKSLKEKIIDMEHRRSINQDIDDLQKQLSTQGSDSDGMDTGNYISPSLGPDTLKEQNPPQLQVQRFEDLLDEQDISDDIEVDDNFLKSIAPYLGYRKSISELEPYLEYQKEANILTGDVQAQVYLNEEGMKRSNSRKSSLHESTNFDPGTSIKDGTSLYEEMKLVDATYDEVDSDLNMDTDDLQYIHDQPSTADSKSPRQKEEEGMEILASYDTSYEQQQPISNNETATESTTTSEAVVDSEPRKSMSGEIFDFLVRRLSSAPIPIHKSVAATPEPEEDRMSPDAEGEYHETYEQSNRRPSVILDERWGQVSERRTPKSSSLQDTNSAGGLLTGLDDLSSKNSDKNLENNSRRSSSAFLDSRWVPRAPATEMESSSSKNPETDTGTQSRKGSSAFLESRWTPRGSTSELDYHSQEGLHDKTDYMPSNALDARMELSTYSNIAPEQGETDPQQDGDSETEEVLDSAMSVEPRSSFSTLMYDFLARRLSGVTDTELVTDSTGYFKDGSDTGSTRASDAGVDLDLTVDNTPRRSSVFLDSRWSPRGSTAGLDNRSRTGSTAGLENRSRTGSTAGLDNRSRTGSTAGLENRSRTGSTAGLENRSRTGSTAGLENRSRTGSTAGLENRSRTGSTAGLDNRSRTGSTAGLENRSRTGSTAGLENRSRTGSTAGLENRSRTGLTAGLDNRSRTGSTAGLENRSRTGSTAGLENRSRTGSTAGLENRSRTGSTDGFETLTPRSSTAGLENRSRKGSTAGLENRSTRGSTAGLENRSTRGSTAGLENRSPRGSTAGLQTLSARGSTVGLETQSHRGSIDAIENTSTGYFKDGSDTGSTRASDAGVDLDLTVDNTPRRSSVFLDSRWSPRGSTAGLDNRSRTGSTAGLENRSRTGSTAGLDNRSRTGSTAGLENRSRTGSTAGLENRSRTGSTAGLENRSRTGSTAGLENRLRTGSTAGLETRSRTGSTAGLENRSRTGSTAGLENRSRTGSTAGLENRSRTGSTAGLENRSRTGSTAGLETRSRTGSTAGLENRSRTGSTAGLENRSRTGSTAGLDNRSRTGSTAGLETLSPRGSTAGLENRSPRGSMVGLENHRKTSRGSADEIYFVGTVQDSVSDPPVIMLESAIDTDINLFDDTNTPNLQTRKSLFEQNAKLPSIEPEVSKQPRLSIGRDMFNALVRRFSGIDLEEPVQELLLDHQKSIHHTTGLISTSLDPSAKSEAQNSEDDELSVSDGTEFSLDVTWTVTEPDPSETSTPTLRGSPDGGFASEFIRDGTASSLVTSDALDSISMYPDKLIKNIGRDSVAESRTEDPTFEIDDPRCEVIEEYYLLDQVTGELYPYKPSLTELLGSFSRRVLGRLRFGKVEEVEERELPLPPSLKINGEILDQQPSPIDEQLMQAVNKLDGTKGWTTMDTIILDKKKKPLDSLEAVTFCGCGFLGIYLVGAATCLQQHRPRLLQGRLGGSSVGSLISTCIVCDVPLQVVRDSLLKTAKASRQYLFGAFNPTFQLEEPLMRNLLELLPEDAHIRASGRLFLSLTRVTSLSNEVVSEYETRDELLRAVLCCCFLPGISGFSVPNFQGRRYIDGGMSNNIPLKSPTTLSINAFSGEFDICPNNDNTFYGPSSAFNQTVNMSNENLRRFYEALLPPEPEKLDQYYTKGYEDTLKYLS